MATGDHERRAWFQLFGREWDCCDNVGHFKDEVREILDDASREELEAMMDSTELVAHRALPRALTVFRGCYDVNRDGLSWSLSRESAERFPFLSRYSRKGEHPLLLTGLVDKRLCVLKLGRNENEIIAPQVRVTVAEELTNPAGSLRPAHRRPNAEGAHDD